jgi:hypothetical protein
MSDSKYSRASSSALVLLALCGVAGCPIGQQGPAPSGSATPGTTAPLGSPTPTPTLTEQPLTLIVSAASTAAMTVEVKDADFKPVRTDLWFYKTTDASYSALNGVRSAEYSRRTAGFFLPADALGVMTGYSPADDGVSRNGVMTDSTDRLAIDGRVTVSLPAGIAAGDKIMVAAAIEDQRYYGAGVFELPSGKPSDAPAFNKPLTHKRVTYEADIKPIIEKSCLGCHSAGGKIARIPMESWHDIVEKPFAGQQGFGFEILVEPGAPALSGFTRRTRPGLGRTPRLWYGKGGYRWGFDPNGNIVNDRRMPPLQDPSSQEPDGDGPPSYYDTHFDEYKVLYDWVAQGAPEK